MARFDLENYETVADRITRFWSEYPNGRIETKMEYISESGKQFVVRAKVYKDASSLESRTDRPDATGYAEEHFSDRGPNETSPLENCETSAIGRALANAGYAPKGKRPSREEMTKVERASKPGIHAELKTRLAVTHPNPEDRKFFLEATVGRQLAGISELTETEVQNILNTLTSKETTNG